LTAPTLLTGDGCFPFTVSTHLEKTRFEHIPSIHKNEITDKGKQDYFAKGLAILQISQLVLSLIVRRTRDLPFSQLETITLGLAACGVSTYIIYWFKPQGVGVPIAIQREPYRDPHHFQRTQDSFWALITNTEVSFSGKPTSRIQNDNISLQGENTGRTVIIALAVMSAAFGCFSFYCLEL
jgi:hypothetical protein